MELDDQGPSLASLPGEVHQQVLSYLPGSALTALCLTCRYFNSLLTDDLIWRATVLHPMHNRSAFAEHGGKLFDTYIHPSRAADDHRDDDAVGSDGDVDEDDRNSMRDYSYDKTHIRGPRYRTWRDLYQSVFAEHGWMLGTWHGNDEWTGQLIEVDYNPETGFIECYRLQPFAHFSFPTRFSRDRSVIWRDFRPDLRARGEVLFRAGRGSERHRQAGDDILRRLVGLADGEIDAQLLEQHSVELFWTRRQDDEAGIAENEDDGGIGITYSRPVWPTKYMPCPERIILSKLDHQSHRREWESWSEHLFTLSRPVFNPMSLITPSSLPIPLPTHTTLFSRLPTADPGSVPAGFEGWQGLFMGDYSAHGPELLYLDYPTPHTIRAVKVTGDPNIPRGEVSWQVDNLRRVKRICDEEEWPGARAFDGLGHVSPHGYSDPSWIEAEVIFYEWPVRRPTSSQSASASASATAGAGARAGTGPTAAAYRPLAAQPLADRFDGTDPLRHPALIRSESDGRSSADSRHGAAHRRFRRSRRRRRDGDGYTATATHDAHSAFDRDRSRQREYEAEMEEEVEVDEEEDDPTRFGVAIWWKEMKHISQFHKVVHVTPPPAVQQRRASSSSSSSVAE